MDVTALVSDQLGPSDTGDKDNCLSCDLFSLDNAHFLNYRDTSVSWLSGDYCVECTKHDDCFAHNEATCEETGSASEVSRLIADPAREANREQIKVCAVVNSSGEKTAERNSKCFPQGLSAPRIQNILSKSCKVGIVCNQYKTSDSCAGPNCIWKTSKCVAFCNQYEDKASCLGTDGSAKGCIWNDNADSDSDLGTRCIQPKYSVCGNANATSFKNDKTFCSCGQCSCKTGYELDTSTAEYECKEKQCTPPNCSGHGTCSQGVCTCDLLYTNASCSAHKCSTMSCAADESCLVNPTCSGEIIEGSHDWLSVTTLGRCNTSILGNQNLVVTTDSVQRAACKCNVGSKYDENENKCVTCESDLLLCRKGCNGQPFAPDKGCSGHGVCKVNLDANSSTCHCNYGYNGVDCSTTLCTTGRCYTGKLCLINPACEGGVDIPDSINKDCSDYNGIPYINANGHRVCRCKVGDNLQSNGKCLTCDSPTLCVDPCPSCLNGGQCVQGTGTCTCPSNFSGRLCNECKTALSISFKGSTTYIDVTLDRITITGHGLLTGDQVVYTKNENATPLPGLLDGSVYWLRKISVDVIELYDTKANANGSVTQGRKDLTGVSADDKLHKLTTASYYGAQCTQCATNCGSHGVCNAGMNGDGTCICDVGWKGSQCNESTCPAGGCGAQGKCGATGCICDLGFSGSKCENYDKCIRGQDLDLLKYPPNCGRYGTCNEATGTCSCSDGTSITVMDGNQSPACSLQTSPSNSISQSSTSGNSNSGNSQNQSQNSCTLNCSGHGRCVALTHATRIEISQVNEKGQGCACNDGYIGFNCDKTALSPYFQDSKTTIEEKTIIYPVLAFLLFLPTTILGLWLWQRCTYNEDLEEALEEVEASNKLAMSLSLRKAESNVKLQRKVTFADDVVEEGNLTSNKVPNLSVNISNHTLDPNVSEEKVGITRKNRILDLEARNRVSMMNVDDNGQRRYSSSSTQRTHVSINLDNDKPPPIPSRPHKRKKAIVLGVPVASSSSKEGIAKGKESKNSVVPKRKSEWIEVKDPKSGKSYYSNRETGQTQWEPPKKFAKLEKEEKEMEEKEYESDDSDFADDEARSRISSNSSGGTLNEKGRTQSQEERIENGESAKEDDDASSTVSFGKVSGGVRSDKLRSNTSGYL
eukprot:g4119.t1